MECMTFFLSGVAANYVRKGGQNDILNKQDLIIILHGLTILQGYPPGTSKFQSCLGYIPNVILH